MKSIQSRRLLTRSLYEFLLKISSLRVRTCAASVLIWSLIFSCLPVLAPVSWTLSSPASMLSWFALAVKSLTETVKIRRHSNIRVFILSFYSTGGCWSFESWIGNGISDSTGVTIVILWPSDPTFAFFAFNWTSIDDRRWPLPQWYIIVRL